MICAQCHETTSETACDRCGGDALLDERYELKVEVGHGAIGVVWRGFDRQRGGDVAIKEIPLRASADPKRRALIDREIAVLQQLDHPCVPRYLGHAFRGDKASRRLYIVQQFIHGETLEAELGRHRFTEAQVLDILEGMCDVLTYLHTLAPPIVHRDIKPGNLIREAGTGRLVLVDFGSVRDALQRADYGGSTIAGTFGYMAPEQFRGEAWPVTDLYALGGVAVALLSRKDPAELHGYDRAFHWEPHVEVSDETRRLLTDLLVANPAERLGSAQALRSRIPACRTAATSPRPAAPPSAAVSDPPPAPARAPAVQLQPARVPERAPTIPAALERPAAAPPPLAHVSPRPPADGVVLRSSALGDLPSGLTIVEAGSQSWISYRPPKVRFIGLLVAMVAGTLLSICWVAKVPADVWVPYLVIGLFLVFKLFDRPAKEAVRFEVDTHRVLASRGEGAETKTREFPLADLTGFVLRKVLREEAPGTWAVATLATQSTALLLCPHEMDARFIARYLARVTGKPLIEDDPSGPPELF